MASALKASSIKDELIPVFCGLAGMLIAVICKKTGVFFIDENWLDAIAIGIYSGLSTVGANQIYKQYKKGVK